MPTLFDDEDFFVPPPKKDSKAKKNVAEALKTPQEAVSDASDAASESVLDQHIAPLETQESIESTPTPDAENIALEKTAEPAATEETVEASDVDSASSEASETETSLNSPEAVVSAEVAEKIEPAIDLNAPVVNAAATELSEIRSNNTGISFEVPEEEEESDFAIEPSATEVDAKPAPSAIPGIKEEVVDDLDKLLRSEIIAQDYTAFSAFRFEPDVEKKSEVVSLEQQEERTAVSIKDLDSENLEFDLDDVNAAAFTLPEFQLEDKYYTIGEVAELFEVNVSHIRFWTTEFKLKVRTTRKGDRLYNPENIARLRLIHHLVKENKYTIKGAKEQLKTQQKSVSQQVDLKEKLSGLKDKLERIKRNL